MKSKYNKLIDSGDDEEDSKPVVKIKPKIAPKPRRREESSSSHAEEELAKDQAKPGTEFHYRELDDEYGSRPVAATSVSEKRKDHDVISMISTSSQEYEAAARNVNIVQNPSKTSIEQQDDEGEEERISPVPADPIIGHEHGVRPLLDDDELENAYGNQVHSKSVDTTDDVGIDDVIKSDNISPELSVNKTEKVDVFGAAPFRRKSKKKTATTLISIPRPYHKEDKLKMVSPIPLMSKSKEKLEHQNKGDGQKHRSNAGIEMTTSLISSREEGSGDTEYINDMFGSIPFVKGPPSSMEILPSVVSPSYDIAGGDKGEIVFSEKQVRSSYSADSLSQKAGPKPADIFGSVPFSSMQGQYIVKQRDIPLSDRTEAQPKVTPDTSVVYRKSLVIEEADKSVDRFNENVMFSSEYQRFDDSDSEETEFVTGETTKFTKSKGSKSPEGQNIESSAFANMSFNDDFDEEEDNVNESLDRLTMPPQDRNGPNMKYSQSQILNVSTSRHPPYTKESSMVNSASGEALKYNSDKYDTFTWPRKRLKGHVHSRATAEPFTVKKKVDI